MNIKKQRTTLKSAATALALVAAVAAGNVYAGDNTAKELKQSAHHEAQEMNSSVRNAWQHGKLETTLLLNRHLNNFTINSHVKNGVATLEGTVASDIDRELAEEVALNIDGIESVDNKLTVDAKVARNTVDADQDADGERRSFAQVIEDATTTAAVKTKLLANAETEGFDINVDTKYDRVTLRGEVDSAEESMLAEKIAANTDDVTAVVNELEIEVEDGEDS